MKKFKVIDFWVSVGLIIAFVVITILEQDFSIGFNVEKENSFITGYLIVGLWQVISIVIHLIDLKRNPLSFTRKMYTFIAFICVATMPMGLFMLGIMLRIAAPMAIFYTCLCGYEIFKKKNLSYEKI